jgi:archaellum biogenesis protein FlaJ (TadC family)
MLGFDFLFQLTHMPAVASAGVTRAQILKMTGQDIMDERR